MESLDASMDGTTLSGGRDMMMTMWVMRYCTMDDMKVMYEWNAE